MLNFYSILFYHILHKSPALSYTVLREMIAEGKSKLEWERKVPEEKIQETLLLFLFNFLKKKFLMNFLTITLYFKSVKKYSIKEWGLVKLKNPKIQLS